MTLKQTLTFFSYPKCVRASSKLLIVITLYLLFITNGYSQDTELTIATFNYPPYEFKKEGKIDGIKVRIVKTVFEKMELPIKLIELPWSRGLWYLKSGEIDGLFGVLWKKEREEFADYSREVLIYETASLFVKQASDISFNGDIAKLKPYSFGVRQDFSYGAKFDKARKEKVFKAVKSHLDPIHLLRLLDHGRIDILIGDKYAIPYLIKHSFTPKSLAPIKRLSPDIEDTPSYLVFSKIKNHQNIRNQFDLELSAMKQSGAYQAIINDWIKHNHNEL